MAKRGKSKPTGKVARKPRTGDLRRSRRKSFAKKESLAPRKRKPGSGRSIFNGLQPNAANFSALTPVAFLPRSADIHPDRVAVIHGRRRYTYGQLYDRARQLASALVAVGVRAGDTVSAMLPNVPAMVEAHYGVPMLGAVLNTINTRLEPATIAYILEHGEAKVLITDREFSAQVGPALAKLKKRPLVIDVDDALFSGPGERLGRIEYEDFIAKGDPHFTWTLPADESSAIALNYTSGTTGNPKGVVYHHRGTFLESVGNIMAWPLPPKPVYLWTLPMFHCNIAAARQGDQSHGGARLSRHPYLRHDRVAGPIDAVRAAGRLGETAARGTRAADRTPGRSLSGGGGPHGGRSEDPRTGAA